MRENVGVGQVAPDGGGGGAGGFMNLAKEGTNTDVVRRWWTIRYFVLTSMNAGFLMSFCSHHM